MCVCATKCTFSQKYLLYFGIFDSDPLFCCFIFLLGPLLQLLLLATTILFAFAAWIFIVVGFICRRRYNVQSTDERKSLLREIFSPLFALFLILSLSSLSSRKHTTQKQDEKKEVDKCIITNVELDEFIHWFVNSFCMDSVTLFYTNVTNGTLILLVYIC